MSHDNVYLIESYLHELINQATCDAYRVYEDYCHYRSKKCLKTKFRNIIILRREYRIALKEFEELVDKI